MKKSILKYGLIITTLILAGCELSTLDRISSGKTSVPKALIAKVDAIKNSSNKNVFVFTQDKDQMTFTTDNINSIIEHNSNLYYFTNSTLKAAFVNNQLFNFGLLEKNIVKAQNHTQIINDAKNLYARLNMKTNSSIKTGELLNYLCFNKVRQVAQTKRIFTPSVVPNGDTLTGVVRINGNTFYDMSCTIQDSKKVVTQLLLKSK